MSRVSASFLVVILSSAAALAQSTPKASTRQYTAGDGSRAVITPLGLSGESRIDIYTAHLDKICSLDYTSEDGEHGLAVAKASWTDDDNFFVFSMNISGGHSPWHKPTYFVSFREYSPVYPAQVCLLDSFLDNPGITTSDFQLTAPNSVTTRVYEAREVVTVSLSAITSQHPVNGKSRCVPCEYQKTVRFGP